MICKGDSAKRLRCSKGARLWGQRAFRPLIDAPEERECKIGVLLENSRSARQIGTFACRARAGLRSDILQRETGKDAR